MPKEGGMRNQAAACIEMSLTGMEKRLHVVVKIL